MELLISLIVMVIVLGVAYWALNKLAAAFGLPAQIVVIIQVLVVLVGVVWLVDRFKVL